MIEIWSWWHSCGQQAPSVHLKQRRAKQQLHPLLGLSQNYFALKAPALKTPVPKQEQEKPRSSMCSTRCPGLLPCSTDAMLLVRRSKSVPLRQGQATLSHELQSAGPLRPTRGALLLRRLSLLLRSATLPRLRSWQALRSASPQPKHQLKLQSDSWKIMRGV